MPSGNLSVAVFMGFKLLDDDDAAIACGAVSGMPSTRAQVPTNHIPLASASSAFGSGDSSSVVNNNDGLHSKPITVAA